MAIRLPSTGSRQGMGKRNFYEEREKASQDSILRSLGLPGGIAYVNPKIQSTLINGLMKQGEFQSLGRDERPQQAHEVLNNLQDLNERGNVDKSSWFGRLFGGGTGADKDAYEQYAGELDKRLKKILPYAVVPKADASAEARKEGLERIDQALRKQFGVGIDHVMGQGQRQQQMQGQGSQPQSNFLSGGAQQQQMQQGQQGQQQESRLGELLRNLLGGTVEAAAPLAQIGGQAVGLAGAGLPIVASDLAQAAEGPRKWALNKVIGSQSPENQEKIREDFGKGIDNQPFLDYIPSTKNIKKVVGKLLPKDYLEPQSKEAALVRDSINKGLGLVGFGGLTPKMAAISTGSGIAGKNIAKGLGGGDIEQNVAELLFTMAPSALFNNARANLKEVAKKGYEGFPGNDGQAQINIPDVKNSARALRDEAFQYSTNPTNKKLFDEMQQFLEKTQFDKIKLTDAVKTNKSINEFLREVDLSKRGQKILRDFNSGLDKAIVKEGLRLKIPGAKEYEQANQIWRGLKNGESIVSTIKDLYNRGNYSSLTLGTLLGRFPLAATGAAVGRLSGMGATAGGIAGLASQELYQTYKFLRNTPGAWAELGKAAKEAAKGSTKAAAARLGKVDKQALKFEQQQSHESSARSRRGL